MRPLGPLAARQSMSLPTPGVIALGEPGNPDVICWMWEGVCLQDPDDAFTYTAYMNYGPQSLNNVDPLGTNNNLQLRSSGFPTSPLTQTEYDDGLGYGTLSAGQSYTAPGPGPNSDSIETSIFYLDSQGFISIVWIDATTGDSIPMQVLYDPNALDINVYLTNDPTDYLNWEINDDGAYDGDNMVSAFLFFYTGAV